jgi:hypothetical protein
VPGALFRAPADFVKAPEATLGSALFGERYFPKGQTNVHLEMKNNLPAPRFRIDVDWEFDIKLDFAGYKEGRKPTYKFTGDHDLFPMITVHIGDQLIYGFDGALVGNNALALADSEDVEDMPDQGLLVSRPFSGEINLPTSEELQKIRGLSVNQTIPRCKE